MALKVIIIRGIPKNGNSARGLGSQVIAQISASGPERCAKVRELIGTPQVRELIEKPVPEPTDGRPPQSPTKQLQLQAQASLVEWHMEKCPNCRSYLNASLQERKHLDRVLAKHLGTSPPRNKKFALFAP